MVLRTSRKDRNVGLELSHKYRSSRTEVSFLVFVVFRKSNSFVSSSSLCSSAGIKQRPLVSMQSALASAFLAKGEYKLKTPDNATKASRK